MPKSNPTHRRDDHVSDKPIQRIAIVGTGVIGASWAAEFLARGLDVVSTDPAPKAEANLREYIDEAWKDLTSIGLSKGASRDRTPNITPELKQKVINGVMGEAAGRPIDQLAQEENRVLIGLLKLREEIGLNKASAEPMAAT